MTTAITPAYLAEFIHRVPVGARIPDGEEYVVHSSLFNGFHLWTSDGEHIAPPSDNPCYTREPIAAPLPTEPGSLVIAHTAKDSTRRVFMRAAANDWFCSHEGLPRWHFDKDLINPVPAKAVGVRL